jgi:hypothetical protein
MQKLGIDLPIDWFDGFGILELDKDRRIMIRLGGSDMNARWIGMELTLVSKTRGKLSEETLTFDAYLKDRKDDRPDWKGNGGHLFVVWYDHVDKTIEWYIAVPRTTKPLAEAVKKYVAAWR